MQTKPIPPHFLNTYDTPSRACYAVMDEFGNLVPCSSVTYWYLFPGIQVTTIWGA